MKISRIELENVKCFGCEKINLEKEDTGEPLSVCAFVGANGSGKSTILKAIVAAFSVLNEQYGGEFFEDDAVKNEEDYLRVSLDIRLSENEKSLLGHSGSILPMEYRHYVGLEDMETDALYVPMDAIQESEWDSYGDRMWDFMNGDQTGIIMYYDPFRFVSRKNPAGPNIQQEENAKQNALMSNIGPSGENMHRDMELKQWLVNLDYLRLKQPTERNEAIYAHMVKAFELLMQPLKFETINQNGGVVFKNETDHQQITIDMLSDGFKSISSVVLDIIKRLALTAESGEEVFYEKEAVVLIDEIDCHIHPKWQRKIMPALRELFPNCQFIITTHSPYILDGLSEYEIKRVGKKEIV